MRFSRARIKHGKRAVLSSDDLEVITAVWPLKIREIGWVGIVRRAAVFAPMELVCCGSSRRRVNDVEGGSTTAFFRAIFDNGDARRNSVDERGASAEKQSVMCGDVDVGVAEFVRGAHQLQFLRPWKVAEIDKAELAECCDEAQREFIFGQISRRKLRRFAIRVLRTGMRERMIEHFAATVDDGELRGTKRKSVAGFYGNSFVVFFGEEFLIGLPAGDGWLVFRIGVFSVVDESPDGETCSELRDAADVIAVIVGD